MRRKNYIIYFRMRDGNYEESNGWKCCYCTYSI